MALSKLRTYYQKSVAEDGEDAAHATWHRDMWHRTIQPPLREEESDDSKEEQTSGMEDSDSDNNSCSLSSSGS
ncbi:hypothetical protein Y1Q_0008035 [Alligator mississippiensis]|uniref:Uncharacterized protein n=1 Tax=Alligator mississippiensis TaxID=8496 RepID=A0A151NFA2_ALLMI|nr:hypothetical protein Y1Q_0008035 [Alligator mississippiensis]